VKFNEAIDDYMAEMRRQSRIASKNSDDAYRRVLNRHSDDVGNRDPAKTGRADIKRTLGRWPHPNSQRQAHAILTSFYDWATEEGVRDTNPARMVRRARPKPVSVFRPTIDEVVRLMDATRGTHASRRRERWVIHLGVLAGLRREEIRLLQGRHFARDGWVWVSKDIAKRGKERWVPVLPELAPIVDEIRATVGEQDFVVPSRRARRQLSRGGVLDNSDPVEIPEKPISAEGLFKMVRRVGRRAQLGADIGPHTLRHAFGDHVARYAGLRAAQALLGHASVATTEESYTGRVSLDELSVSVQGFQYRRVSVESPAAIPQDGPNAR
jgi:integrase